MDYVDFNSKRYLEIATDIIEETKNRGGILLSRYEAGPEDTLVTMLEPTPIFKIRYSDNFSVMDQYHKLTSYSPETVSLSRVFMKNNVIRDPVTRSPKIIYNRLSIFPTLEKQDYEIFLDVEGFEPRKSKIFLRPAYISKIEPYVRDKVFELVASKRIFNNRDMAKLEELAEELNSIYFKNIVMGKAIV